ncbi:MAG: hypothetical protein KF716_33605 [Anaerolineae bacterium]|nr:hypothetical protein [Anaerolineae bacterium]
MAEFPDILHSWQNFYFMAGGAAATLIGLMFVALSLGMHLVNKVTEENFRIFAAPSIYYFVSALLICCVMLVPTFTPRELALIVLFGAVVGLIVTIPRVWKLVQAARKHQDFNFWDWLTQIIFPVLSYVLFGAGGLCLFIDQWSLGIVAVWLATVLLLLAAIANTWSLVLWIIEQNRD